MNAELFLSICLGIGLSASSGFRIFVPLFVMSITAHFGMLPLSENWIWLGSTSAIIILAVASIAESLAYLVPVVDNLLDSIAIPLASVAGTITMMANLGDVSPAMNWALAIIAGGGTAAMIKTTNAAGRVASTSTTAGLANPIIAMAETGTAVGLSVLAVFAPMLAVGAVAIGLVLLIWFIKKVKKKT